MLKKVLTNGIVLVLIILNFFLIYKKKKNQDQLKLRIETIESEKKVLLYELGMKNDIYTYLFDKIPSNAISVILNESQFLKSINEKKVFLYFNRETCGSCILKVMQDLEILASKIGKENILITTNLGENNRAFDNQDFDFPHHYIESFHLKAEESNGPIVFISDNSLNIDHLFLPELLPQFRQQYFLDILPSIFKK